MYIQSNIPRPVRRHAHELLAPRSKSPMCRVVHMCFRWRSANVHGKQRSKEPQTCRSKLCMICASRTRASCSWNLSSTGRPTKRSSGQRPSHSLNVRGHHSFMVHQITAWARRHSLRSCCMARRRSRLNMSCSVAQSRENRSNINTHSYITRRTCLPPLLWVCRSPAQRLCV